MNDMINPLNTQQRRSMISFIVIALFAVGAAIFVVRKGSQATSEIDSLNSNHFTAHRALIIKELDEREGLGASSTQNYAH